MFNKKRTNTIKKKNLRKSKEEDEHEEEQSSNTITAERIDQIKKKRKILETVHSKRGVDSAELLTTANVASSRANNAEKNDDTNDNEEAQKHAGDGILDQKHRQAMEEYVSTQLAAKASNVAMNPNESPTGKAKNSLSEDALFSELAEAARHLSGKDSTAPRDDSAAISANPATTADPDGGSGGAVLVAGTGLAEVILPAPNQSEVDQKTRQAKVARREFYQKKYDVPAPVRPQAVPNRFAVSANVSYRPNRSDTNESQPQTSLLLEDDAFRGMGGGGRDPAGVIQGKEPQSLQQPSSGAEVLLPPDVAAADEERVGFESLKQGRHHKATSASNSGDKPLHMQSSDQRVFRTFINRQRENMKK